MAYFLKLYGKTGFSFKIGYPRVWSRVSGRVGFYPRSKSLLGSGRVTTISGRVLGFSGTRCSPITYLFWPTVASVHRTCNVKKNVEHIMPPSRNSFDIYLLCSLSSI